MRSTHIKNFLVVVVGTALLLLLLFWEVMVDVNTDDKYMENNATKIDNYKRSAFHGFTVGSTRAIIVDLFLANSWK